MAVGILFSNVMAYVEDDAVLSAAGDITVYARGGSTPVTRFDPRNKNAALEKASKGSENGVTTLRPDHPGGIVHRRGAFWV